jgi:hypothetical protein
VVWGDRLFLTTAISGKEKAELRVGLYGDIAPVQDDTVHQWKVLCFDKRTGKLLWERTAHSGVPKIPRHTKGTHANSTMATDGTRAVACFGSEGLYCYDFRGELLWKKDLGVIDSGFFSAPTAQWGYASSPVLWNGLAIVQADSQKNGFLAAFDLKDGREVWRTPRTDVPTWSTPAVVTVGDRAQVVVNGWRHIGGYDARTGREVWRLTGGGDIPVPTPIFARGLLFITNAHGRMAPIYAIRPGATGDISLQGEATANEHVAWSTTREATTGRRLYQERLGTGRTGFSASAVAADGKLYYPSETGEIYVVKPGPAFEVLSVNPMGEVCMATPAISEGRLYFRTQGHLVAIGGR